MSSSDSITILDPHHPDFPHFSHTHSSGIIAIGGTINTQTLLKAYSQGIFPWYNDDLPLWWNPDPRFVLFPDELKVSKSMRTYFNNNKFDVSFNTCFEDVIIECMHIPRRGQGGTWLNEEMVKAYGELHELGYAHSVEVWNQDGRLAGGAYGLGIGKIFFGESMFSKASNASKFGFISLVRKLQHLGIQLIDCQQKTKHLQSLGAKSIPRDVFMKYLYEYVSTDLEKLKLF